ncbi:MAG: type VI immunity family protein [Polyangiaceae bacterium]
MLGASFQLELLEPDDEARLEQALHMAWDWLAPELRTARLSVAEDPEPVRPQHLEYISSYAASLRAATADDPGTQRELNNHAKLGRTDYAVDLTGAVEDETASPFSLCFWAEIGEVDPIDEWLPAFATLTVTVPHTWPVADFQDRVLAMAAPLRLRWGAAGFGYSAVYPSLTASPARAIYAHARRHPGYDLGFHMQCMEALYRRIRTISWLTLVGPALLDELAAAGRRLVDTPSVALGQAGSAAVLRAGNTPLAGDVNRLDVPAAYREADALLRPVRADDPQGLVALGPWTDDSLLQWLRRFELRVS